MKFRPRQWVSRIAAAREAERQSTINAQCRCDEVRLVLRQGTAEERAQYLEASRAWREAGQPDVPFISLWFDPPEPEIEL